MQDDETLGPLFSPSPSPSSAEDESTEPPRRIGHPLIAWFAIFLVVGFIAYKQNATPDPTLAADEEDTAPQDVITLLQGRYFVGAGDLFKKEKRQLFASATVLNQGTLEQRLCYVILSNEMVGPEAALETLDDLQILINTSDVEFSDEQIELLTSVKALILDYNKEEWDAPSLDEKQRKQLTKELGWFGKLALAPPKSDDAQARKAVIRPARVTAISLLGGIGLFCMLLLGGFFVLAIFSVLTATGGVQSAMRFPPSNHTGVYAEAFALWLVLFLILTGAASLYPNDRLRMLVVALAMFGSLFCLVWPWIRGVSWRNIREEIGWTAGENPLFEPVAGLVTYSMVIPLLFVGFLAMLMLMVLSGTMQPQVAGADDFSPTGLPSHPIITLVGDADWFTIFQLYLVAAIGAPVVEETMFRGVLYHHLRQVSRGWGFVLSFAFAAIVNSFIFAVIHPQGYIAVPALMAIAGGLTIAREWRGTLIPCMVAHGIHNGLLVTFLILALGS